MNTTNINSRQTSREAALERVQQLNFAMIELGLFLNTHPNDENALNLFDKVQCMHAIAKEKYEECYGPLTYEGVNTPRDGWSWINGPWPWEGGC